MIDLQGGKHGLKYDKFAADWHEANEVVHALDTQREAANNESVRNLLGTRILLALDQRDALISNFFSRIRADLDLDSDGSNTTEKIKRAAALLQNTKLKTIYSESVSQIDKTQKIVALFDSDELEHSKYASVVAGANDAYWVTKFDNAEGSGYSGNVDVAIKALGPTNFTIKGLSFNPADVAIAASKVTTQAVLLAAQISGVPVNVSGTPTGDGTSLAQSSMRLQQARNDIIESKNKLESFDAALSVIADTILREADAISSTVQGRINAVYTSQKDRLEVTASEGENK